MVCPACLTSLVEKLWKKSERCGGHLQKFVSCCCAFKPFSFSSVLFLALGPGAPLCQPSQERLWPFSPSSISAFSECFLQALPYAFIVEKQLMFPHVLLQALSIHLGCVVLQLVVFLQWSSELLQISTLLVKVKKVLLLIKREGNTNAVLSHLSQLWRLQCVHNCGGHQPFSPVQLSVSSEPELQSPPAPLPPPVLAGAEWWGQTWGAAQIGAARWTQACRYHTTLSSNKKDWLHLGLIIKCTIIRRSWNNACSHFKGKQVSLRACLLFQ